MTIKIIKKSRIMKRELTVDMRVVKDHGANAAVVLAVIKDSYEPMTITDVSKAVGITYPTAHKCLDILADNSFIKRDGKAYRKI
jgi:predicted transcriptional regulator